MALFVVLSLLLVQYGAIAAAAALAVDTLFRVDFSTDEFGGCRTAGRTAIQNMLDEAETLAGVGVQLVDNYGQTSGEAKRLLDVFVNGNTDAHRTTMKNYFSGVQAFLARNENVPNGGKPYLFCSDTWLDKNTLKSEARDSEGNSFPKGDLSGLPALIENVPAYMDKRNQNPRTLRTPYWSFIHNQYLFDAYYSSKGGFCSKDENIAVTSDLLLPATVTLCPKLFRQPVSGLGVQITPLTSSVIPLRPRDIPNNAQRLSDILPSSTTLYHELFHLIHGSANTYPAGGEKYTIIDLGKLSADDALANPETYAAVSIAYWYTLNVAPVNNNRVEFYGFFATRG
ncbi:hypothetical protein CkaCkLH20_10695 [Colletotrichum karsti]|uniref:Lysine-specific metallo-endopeptidase domain-containing protein n=1 Tax=Colletotrichum karsti TaxID=1095194 RepID=A0A9P6I0I3_9PEZI|nr:uncharacterized protein CkaCkLH20_10695 [Colletotrichum karsti]KAF9871761.1 hypothetical protein CkaCkLH20_10695 [Colletotrichum karsti]